MSPKISLFQSTVIDRQFTPQDILSLILDHRHLELSPSYPQIDLDFSLAVKLVRQAIAARQQILIYGDYDVDGLTATAILWQAIRTIYPHVTPFIPNREKDGYGFKYQPFLDKYDLIITVDNGIVAHLEFKKLQPHQQVIIVDHHLPADKNPVVSAIVHSTSVSASALSWFFAKNFDPNADLGLAALGTVADCLPLVGINRSLVTHGLQSLRLNPSPGIKKILDLASIKTDRLSAYDLGFIIGPRLNAAGRLADPTDALRLLCSQNSLQATKYAQILNSYNRDRQELQQELLDLAESKIKLSHKLIFLSDPNFHPGIIGLLAGRLTEKYYLPSIVVGQNGKGSCRSIKELNIIDTLRQCSDLFVDLGGHAAAAGFTILEKNIHRLEKQITKIINQKLKNTDLVKLIEVDARMKLNAVTRQNIEVLSKLEPFGLGNPKPLFYFENLKIVSKRLLNGNHLKLKLDDPNTPKNENIIADAIAFKKGELDKTLNIGDSISLVASLDLNVWQGTTTPQLVVKEIIWE